jgi:tungstate transport system permease protein
MADFSDALAAALRMLLALDPELLAIVGLSLQVSLSAVACAAVLGLPLGAVLAIASFPGRGAIVTFLNAMTGLPPVVVGLLVYFLLSRSGPLGEAGLLFTPTAMALAQTILVLPIIAALTRQTVADLWLEYALTFRSHDLGRARATLTLLREGRFSLATALLAGFGRAAAEVGAIILVGGNIRGHTRTMTTAIALETSKGELALALGLGLVLIAVVVMVNAAVGATTELARRRGAG